MTTHSAGNAHRLPTSATPDDLAAAVASLTEADGRLQQQASEDWEGRYRTLFDALPDACFVTDVRGVIREANYAVSGVLGFARTYCIGKPLASYIAPEDTASFLKALAQVAAVTEEGKPRTWKGRFRSRGNRPPARVAVRPTALRDREGALMGYIWLVRDVSAEWRLTEQYQTLMADQDVQLRARTAELEAVVRVQAALIEQYRMDQPT